MPEQENDQNIVELPIINNISAVRRIKDEAKESGRTKAPDAVLEALTQIELDKHKNLILSGIKELEHIEVELNKLKPDHIFVDHTGLKCMHYTPQRYNEISKHKDIIAKLNIALNEALDNADYQKLTNIVGNIQKPNKSSSEAETQKTKNE